MCTILKSQDQLYFPAGKLPGRPACPTQELTYPGKRTGVLSRLACTPIYLLYRGVPHDRYTILTCLGQGMYLFIFFIILVWSRVPNWCFSNLGYSQDAERQWYTPIPMKGYLCCCRHPLIQPSPVGQQPPNRRWLYSVFCRLVYVVEPVLNTTLRQYLGWALVVHVMESSYQLGASLVGHFSQHSVNIETVSVGQIDRVLVQQTYKMEIIIFGPTTITGQPEKEKEYELSPRIAHCQLLPIILWDRSDIMWPDLKLIPILLPLHSQISPASLTRNITSHNMKNLAIHSLLRWKMIILPILTTSLTCTFLVGRMYLLNLGVKGLTLSLLSSKSTFSWPFKEKMHKWCSENLYYNHLSSE